MKQLTDTLISKNEQYGSAFKEVREYLLHFYPNGIQPKDFAHALLMVRIYDKLKRISNGHYEDSWEDIAGYAVLGTLLENRKFEKHTLIKDNRCDQCQKYLVAGDTAHIYAEAGVMKQVLCRKCYNEQTF